MASSQRKPPHSKLPDTMTADEFMSWPGDGAGGKYELVDGVLRAMSPGSATHARLQMRIGRLIDSHLDGAGKKC